MISKDVERLPEGFKRIAYDSDSAKFTFRDRNGNLYQGEAGADYGILTPMSAALSSSRPNAFSSGTFSILYTTQLSDSSTVPRHQIHHHQYHHHVEGRPILNRSRHSKISYPLTSSLLPLRFPKRARARAPSVLQLLSKIS